ncbi:MAG: hypothetical protein KIS92_23115, partial [Planctomycetota bacterium]|nr:hypothetical protein [Planctomycetota bacterium]
MSLEHRVLGGGLSLVLACSAWAAEVAAPPPPALNPLGGPAPSEAAERGFALLLEGKEAEAYKTFEAAAQKGEDANALFGLALCQRMRGQAQDAVLSLTKALQAGRQNPWADVYLAVLDVFLNDGKDPKPFLEAAAALENDANVRPYLRDRIRHVHADWLARAGRFDDAAKLYEALQYANAWALIGPFDNRDKAGFETEYEPENTIDFEKPVPGRNRPVTWFHPKLAPMNGVVGLSEVFEPPTHSLAYAVTHLKVEKAQWAVMRVGCAGAAKVWLNDREVLQLDEYNEYAPEKGAAPVYLQKGVNQLLVKTAVVEETGWSFSVRFSRPEGGPVEGLLFDAGAEALKAYKTANVGRATPLLEPEDPDLGVVMKMRAALKAAPGNALLRAFYGDQMDARKLGNKEDNISVKEYAKAVELRPACPLFLMMLSYGTQDFNQARQAAEAAAASHPDLPMPQVRLAQMASDSSMEVAAEACARAALAKFGNERAAECLKFLANAQQQRGQGAEASRNMKLYTEQRPYDADGWSTLYQQARTTRERREILARALERCGGDSGLRAIHAEDLGLQEKGDASAEYLAAGLRVDPFAIGESLEVARAWRRAGKPAQARQELEAA